MSTWDEKTERVAAMQFPKVPIAEEAGVLRVRGRVVNCEAEKRRSAFARGPALGGDRGAGRACDV